MIEVVRSYTQASRKIFCTMIDFLLLLLLMLFIIYILIGKKVLVEFSSEDFIVWTVIRRLLVCFYTINSFMICNVCDFLKIIHGVIYA